MTDGGTSAAQGSTTRMRLRYQRGPPATGAAVETGSLSELVVMTESYGDPGVETVNPDFIPMSDERNELLLRTCCPVTAAAGAWWVDSVAWIAADFEPDSPLPAMIALFCLAGVVAIT
ncbi:MAG TPA: hypothetical protein DCY63_01335 [Acidimicrobiaceae bacterium]|nr:hypothetical protein [Acidimicrobiaceae bacterium]